MKRKKRHLELSSGFHMLAHPRAYTKARKETHKEGEKMRLDREFSLFSVHHPSMRFPLPTKQVGLVSTCNPSNANEDRKILELTGQPA